MVAVTMTEPLTRRAGCLPGSRRAWRRGVRDTLASKSSTDPPIVVKRHRARVGVGAGGERGDSDEGEEEDGGGDDGA